MFRNIILLSLFLASSLARRNCEVPFELYSGRNILIPESTSSVEELCTFCYNGDTKHLANIFISSTLKLSCSGEDISLHQGENATEVENKYKEAKSSWFNLLPWKATLIHMKPFTHSCVGIVTRSTYNVKFMTQRLDLWRMVYVAVATAVFFGARKICGSLYVYYVTGVSFGVMGFMLLLVYLSSRLIPKKPVALSVIVGGWSFSLYFMQKFWENMVDILVEHSIYIYAYVAFTSAVSFALLYRYQPLSHARSRDLLSWSLQGCALGVILWSSHLVEASLAYSIILMCIYNFPPTLKTTIHRYWLRKFPPKRRMLTEEEYLQEGHEETKKALQELRDYCSSPECNTWKTVSKLKSPHRFADFMNGSSHLNDEEVLDHTIWEEPEHQSSYGNSDTDALVLHYDNSEDTFDDEGYVANGT